MEQEAQQHSKVAMGTNYNPEGMPQKLDINAGMGWRHAPKSVPKVLYMFDTAPQADVSPTMSKWCGALTLHGHARARDARVPVYLLCGLA